MVSAIVLVAEGSEDVEAVTPVDYLRRAGVDVLVAGSGGVDLRLARGLRVVADSPLAEAASRDFDCVVVPGGPGAARLAADPLVAPIVRRHFLAGKVVAAVCAAPALVLGEACGILEGRRWTCFPGYEDRAAAGTFVAERVVSDGNLVTGRAAGCSGEWSAAIVAALVGPEAARELAERVLL
jgi:4-methyl-5(b-hydroxyethyl)-thiazole monophosphate biosynthesis